MAKGSGFSQQDRLKGGVRGRLSQKKRRNDLQTQKVKFPIQTTEEARNDLALDFGVQRLSEGCPWDQLRHEFGCGPAHRDKKWKILKAAIESHLKMLMFGHFAHLRDMALESEGEFAQILYDLDEKISNEPEKAHIYLALKLKVIKYICDVNRKVLLQEIRWMDLMKKERFNQGASIILRIIRANEGEIEQIRELGQSG